VLICAANMIKTYDGAAGSGVDGVLHATTRAPAPPPALPLARARRFLCSARRHARPPRRHLLRPDNVTAPTRPVCAPTRPHLRRHLCAPWASSTRATSRLSQPSPSQSTSTPASSPPRRNCFRVIQSSQIVEQESLVPLERMDGPSVICVAAWFGKVRLIDNIEILRS
jgi:hypothetical protein